MITPLLEIRFNMRATVLNYQYETADPATKTDPADAVKGGHWEVVQDEDTGGIKRVWMEDQVVATPTPGVNRSTFHSNIRGQGAQFDIECVVRGFPEVGFRSTANTESFLGGNYRPFEAVQMSYPSKYTLSRRQLVTNIRNQNGTLLWVEEDTGKPTVFEVQGVTPTFDPFGRHIDNLTVLKRADVQ